MKKVPTVSSRSRRGGRVISFYSPPRLPLIVSGTLFHQPATMVRCSERDFCFGRNAFRLPNPPSCPRMHCREDRMHNLLIAIGTLSLVGSLVCVILASDQYWELQFELNERLPEGEKFEPRSWLSLTTGNWSRFRELQRRILPDSPRPRRFLRLALSGVGLLVCSIVIFLVAHAQVVRLTGQ
jgi:hypothetical protein